MARSNVSPQGGLETLVQSAARTTDGDSGVLTGWGGVAELRVQLDVTAASGTTPTLDVVVEDTLDGTNWHEVGALPQATATGAAVIDVTTPFSDQLRVSWTIAGTSPSFTFSVVTFYRYP